MAKSFSTSEKMVRQIRRKSRKKYLGELKIRIELDELRGEEIVREMCRREVAKRVISLVFPEMLPRMTRLPNSGFLLWETAQSGIQSRQVAQNRAHSKYISYTETNLT